MNVSLLLNGACSDPSRYRYQRGCRCDDCREAAAVYKRARLEEAARAEGRVHGERPCAECGTPISLLGGANRKTYCDDCRERREKERRAQERVKRRESMRLYLREYYRKNKDELRVKHREYYEAHRAEYAAYSRRRRPELRAWKRNQYNKKDTPTVHERALETFGYRTSYAGFRLAKCRCGCGLYVNAGHVAVARLFKQGYTRNEIAARLGVHPTEVSYLKLDGENRSWAWYRRGHHNLIGLKPQPAQTRRRLSKGVELRLLIEQQGTEADFGARAKSITGRSLDAPMGSTDNFALVDVIAAPAMTGEYTDEEESFLDWLHRHELNLDELAQRCLDDETLAAELRYCMESGRPSDQIHTLLLEATS